MHSPETLLKNEMHKICWDFEKKHRSPNFGQTTRPSDSQQKKRNC